MGDKLSQISSGVQPGKVAPEVGNQAIFGKKTVDVNLVASNARTEKAVPLSASPGKLIEKPMSDRHLEEGKITLGEKLQGVYTKVNKAANLYNTTIDKLSGDNLRKMRTMQLRYFLER